MSREFDTLWKKNLDAIGIRTELQRRQVARAVEERARRQAAGLVAVGSAADPDGQGALQRYYGPQTGGQNLARFKNAEFDAIYERMQSLPDGPERDALFRRAKTHRRRLHALQAHRAPRSPPTCGTPG